MAERRDAEFPGVYGRMCFILLELAYISGFKALVAVETMPTWCFLKLVMSKWSEMNMQDTHRPRTTYTFLFAIRE